ncbi:amino acid carrier protein [Deinococcus proteolyticus MRP]|uniref:Amino acid carrier protein n=1 Tax=Deinococcus proteolyticus (strain ATCC 35074 / DSM 20540 / JCM 6276 / NBRC 101906 / NCIMB 13154 / VKM Ac-1939 / CCM 2703 / MRP) TaxID=693977 RepID=F0RIW8_DEIPM|nr:MULTISPECIES: alanine/glycine:cation symporter family protein [Deinococcus]ADY25227.1 amino acid carrier protein [Deinococcus proteolyticus MRP]MCY1703327.1 alanine/glycine:cation symporter family protein [Deinococcus sp. SL84]
MKRPEHFFLALAAATSGFAAASAPAAPVGIDDRINAALAPVSNAVASTVFYSVPVGGADLPLIVLWLITAAIIFTLYLGFINLRGFRHAIDIVRGKYDNHSSGPGEVSHFQALTAAVSGTVGLGNIAGVAVAISLGGPGATFWMIVAGLLGMSSKFVECTLGVKYRRENPDGSVSGGPMFYLSRGLAERGMGGLGSALAAIFAVAAIFGSLGGGNMFQSNQTVLQLVSITGGDASPLAPYKWLLGIVIAGIVGSVIIGGIKSIANVTDKLVPFMAGLYVFGGLLVLLLNAGQIPAAISSIISGAFSPEGVAGGAIGVLIQGIRRATFSNEAGIGSAAIAHSAVKTDRPVTEGYVSLLEPFIDTVVICTMTALTLVVTGVYKNPDLSGVTMTSAAFSSVVPQFSWFVTLAVILFAISTIITWAYYGTKAVGYLTGENKTAILAFQVFFLIATVIGASLDLNSIIDFSDSMIFVMSIPNIIGLYLLMPVVKRELAEYRADLNSGRIQRTG